ncbi:reticulon-4 receptor-like 2 [Petromyzon marinus]|uniref:reticulon-4 receptor-like 2 n=1 Tax=Petromyzon marinus TaxID=7757 RepID=UPI003F717A75
MSRLRVNAILGLDVSGSGGGGGSSSSTAGLGFVCLLLLWLSPASTSDCPKNCSCYMLPVTANCQSLGFVRIPSGLPRNSHRVLLQNNRITAVPRENALSPDTVALSLFSNNITIIQPGAFAAFSRLDELDLGNNRYLQWLDADTFLGLVNLHTLHLYRCGLQELPDRVFAGLRGLQHLYLQQNELMHLQDDLFGELSNLTHLFLHGNKLLSLSDNVFRGLHSLDKLLLHHNRLRAIRRRIFRGLSALSTLYLFNNELTELSGHAMGDLSGLQYLRLNNNTWACDCRLFSLWEWFKRFRGSSTEVVCHSPSNLVNRNLRSLAENTFMSCNLGPTSSTFYAVATHPFRPDKASGTRAPKTPAAPGIGVGGGVGGGGDAKTSAVAISPIVKVPTRRKCRKHTAARARANAAGQGYLDGKQERDGAAGELPHLDTYFKELDDDVGGGGGGGTQPASPKCSRNKKEGADLQHGGQAAGGGAAGRVHGRPGAGFDAVARCALGPVAAVAFVRLARGPLD